MVLTTNGADEKTVLVCYAGELTSVAWRRRPNWTKVWSRISSRCATRCGSITDGGRRELVPVIRNLIFVHTTPPFDEVPQTEYAISPVPDGMEGRQACSYCRSRKSDAAVHRGLRYLRRAAYLPGADGTEPDERAPVSASAAASSKGRRGTYLKLKGHRDKRVVVAIRGVIAVALATVHPSMIEVIK